MNDHARTALIVAACTIAAILILLFIVWRFCYKNGKFILYLKKVNDEEAAKIISSGSRKRDFLIKRCDQESTRNIEERIIQRLKKDGRIVDRPWDQALDGGKQPVVVFCVISSRIGTDIENAMRGVHGDSSVILVVLHPVLRELLKGDLSDDEELLDPAMKNRMTGIAHFAFSEREGLYDCRQNTVGFSKLASLVKSD